MNAELSPAGGPVFRIYRARPADVADLHGLVRALADHERLGGLCTSTPDDLADALFGRLPAAEALIAILMGILSFMSDFVGFGLFFILTRHSSAAGGLWLEDVFVRPEYRGFGIVRELLAAVARIARKRRCDRFQWAVLDWNVGAVAFYESLGAAVLPGLADRARCRRGDHVPRRITPAAALRPEPA